MIQRIPKFYIIFKFILKTNVSRPDFSCKCAPFGSVIDRGSLQSSQFKAEIKESRWCFAR